MPYRFAPEEQKKKILAQRQRERRLRGKVGLMDEPHTIGFSVYDNGLMTAEDYFSDEGEEGEKESRYMFRTR